MSNVDWAKRRALHLKQIYDSAQGTYSSIHQRLYKAYMAYQNAGTESTPWSSQEKIPIIYNAVRQTYARVLNAWETADVHVRVRPSGFSIEDPEELELKSLLLQNVAEMNYRLGENQKAVAEAVLDALIAGWGILKSGHRTLFEKRIVGDTPNKIPIQEYAELVRVSPFNLLVDPGATSIQNARWTFEVLEISRETAKIEAVKGRWRPDAEEKISWLTSKRASDLRKETLKIRRMGQSGIADVYGYGLVVEAWSWEDPDGDGVPTLWVFWFDEQTGELLGYEENYFQHGERPYAVGTATPVPDSIFGIGLAESLYSLWEKASTTLAQIEENISSQNIRHFVERMAGIDMEAFQKSIANGIIPCDNINGIKSVSGPPLPSDHWGIMSLYDSKVQETSLVTPIVMGMKAASTAYGTSVLQGQSDAAFDITISNLTRTLMTPAMRQFVKNIQQFMAMPVVTPVNFGSAQAPPAPISPDNIQGDFYIEAANVRSEASMKAQAQAMGALLNQMLQLGIPANYPWLIVQIYQRLGLPEAHKAFEGMLFTPQRSQENPGGLPGQNEPIIEGGLETPGNSAPISGEPMGTPRLAMSKNTMGAMPADLSGMLIHGNGG